MAFIASSVCLLLLKRIYKFKSLFFKHNNINKRYSSLKKSLVIIKLLYNLLTSLSVNQEEKEVKRLERSLVFKAKEVKGLYKLT